MQFSKNPSPLFESVGSTLMKAGWIEIFTLRARDGYALKWTPMGESKLLSLQPMIDDFGTANEGNLTTRFTLDCRTQIPSADKASEDVAGQFWFACLEELSLACEADTLRTFLQLIRVGNDLPARTSTSFELGILRWDNFPGSLGGYQGRPVANP